MQALAVSLTVSVFVVGLMAACQSLKESGWPESHRTHDGTLVIAEGEASYTEFLKNRKLVPVRREVPGVKIDLRYATRNNITGRRLYSANARCYLDQDTARKLARAQALLNKQGIGLKVWDGYRPASVQKELWNAVPKADFVVDPRLWYSKHSSGRAVDVTLVDLQTGEEKKMPSDFDDFSPRGRALYLGPDREVRRNVELLQTAMKEAGFRRINSEWWHFANAEFYNENIPPFRKSL
ncbi:MAG: M15 family metallopeptidase [Verrucomicrobiota bacterium]